MRPNQVRNYNRSIGDLSCSEIYSENYNEEILTASVYSYTANARSHHLSNYSEMGHVGVDPGTSVGYSTQPTSNGSIFSPSISSLLTLAGIGILVFFSAHCLKKKVNDFEKIKKQKRF